MDKMKLLTRHASPTLVCHLLDSTSEALLPQEVKRRKSRVTTATSCATREDTRKSSKTLFFANEPTNGRFDCLLRKPLGDDRRTENIAWRLAVLKTGPVTKSAEK